MQPSLTVCCDNGEHNAIGHFAPRYWNNVAVSYG